MTIGIVSTNSHLIIKGIEVPIMTNTYSIPWGEVEQAKIREKAKNVVGELFDHCSYHIRDLGEIDQSFERLLAEIPEDDLKAIKPLLCEVNHMLVDEWLQAVEFNCFIVGMGDKDNVEVEAPYNDGDSQITYWDSCQDIIKAASAGNARAMRYITALPLVLDARCMTLLKSHVGVIAQKTEEIAKDWYFLGVEMGTAMDEWILDIDAWDHLSLKK